MIWTAVAPDAVFTVRTYAPPEEPRWGDESQVSHRYGIGSLRLSGERAAGADPAAEGDAAVLRP